MKVMDFRKSALLLISLIVLTSSNPAYAEQTGEPVQNQGYRISGYINPNATDKAAAKSGISIPHTSHIPQQSLQSPYLKYIQRTSQNR